MMEEMSNMYENGYRRGNGRKNPVMEETKDRTTTTKDIKATVVDNAQHRNGPDSIYAPQNPRSVETARREETTKRCVVVPKKYNMWIEQLHHLKKISEITTKSKNPKHKQQQKERRLHHVTLLVNNAPIKYIIDNGSPVTLIPQHLFNKTTKVETKNTDYKDVNDNKIEFAGQTNATVKTNTNIITTTTTNYKSKYNTANRTRRLDETAENNNQLKHRSYPNT